MNRFLWSLLVALAACLALAFGHLPDLVKVIIGLPGAAALLLALWELAKTKDGPQPQPIQQPNPDDTFILGATAYMAERAFDKHVEFCESYVAKVNETLLLLFELGPGEKILRRAAELCQIRRQFALWETADVAVFLSKFEAALRDVGEENRHLRQGPAGAERGELVTKVSGIFGPIVRFEDSPGAVTPEVAIICIVGTLQERLGIAQLTALRQHYLTQAVRRIQPK